MSPGKSGNIPTGPRTLTVALIKSLKPRTKTYRVWGTGGLLLEVHPRGSIYFRFKYRYRGMQRWLALGVWPHTTLADANRKLLDAKNSLANGRDPLEARREEKEERLHTFRAVALDWLRVSGATRKERTNRNIREALERSVFPDLGNRPMTAITAKIALPVFERIANQGKRYTAKKLLQYCASIADHADRRGITDRNPFRPLSKALPSSKPRHFAAIVDPPKFGELLRAVDGYGGDILVRYALQLAALLALRSGELRNLRWDSINWIKRQITLKAEEKKEARSLVVPLSEQAMAILQELRGITGGGPLVLGVRSGTKPLSDITLNAALRRLGYSGDQHTTHGFRASFRTLGAEVLEASAETLEIALGHRIPGFLSDTYNRADYVAKRTVLAQAWADLLDELRTKTSAREAV